MSRDPSSAGGPGGPDGGAADALRDVHRQLDVVDERSGTAKAQLVALGEQLDAEGPAAVEAALSGEPSLSATVDAIRADALSALHRELSEVVVAAPEAVPDEDLVDRLDDAADRLTDHHDRLAERTGRLAELADPESFDEDAAREAVDDAVHRTNRVRLSARRLRGLLSEIAPAGAGPTGDAFAVTGTVTQDGEPLAGVRVRAFDRDVDGLEALGEATTGPDGSYRIAYREADFARAEEGTADVVVRVYDELDRQLAESGTRYDAGRETTVDVRVPPGRRAVPTEYVRLRAALRPVLSDQAVADLADDQVEFLKRELELSDRDAFPAGDETVTMVRNAARLATRTPFDVRVLYALARERGTPDLDRDDLAQSDPAELAGQVAAAVEANVVALSTEGLQERLADRVEQLRRATELEAGEEARATVRLAADDGTPLAGTAVRVRDPDGDGPGRTFRTGDDGTVAFSYVRRPGADGPRRFDVTVVNEAGAELHEETVAVDDGEAAVTVAERSSGFSGAATLSSLRADLDIPLPATDDLAGATLGAVRRSGGAATLAPSLSPDDRERVGALASLDLLADPGTAGALVERGYANQPAIAATPLPDFQRSVAESLDPEAAARVHATAQAQTYVLDGALLDRLGALRNGTGGGGDGG